MRNQLPRLTAGLMLGLCLGACSADTASVASKGSGSVTSTLNPLAASKPEGIPSYHERDMSHPVNEMTTDCDRVPDTLHDLLLHTSLSSTDPDRYDRAAAIVKVVGVGPARWNTPDGQRPSQRYEDALQHPTPAPDGTWPVDPSIFTPYTMTVLKSLRGTQGFTDNTITGYVSGGTVGQDNIQGCPTEAARFEQPPGPTVGHSYVVFFGRELTVYELGTGPLKAPRVDGLDPYDGATGAVKGFFAPTTLSKALEGLPSN